MSKITLSVLFVAFLSGCAFNPPKPPMPSDSPRVPVNASEPQLQGMST